ncbi:MAG: sterol desaturase family protein [Pseudomonadota bacterium]
MEDAITTLSTLASAFWPVGLGICLAVALERLIPNGARPNLDGLRWLQTVIIYLAGIVFARLVLPVTVAGAAVTASEGGIGLFNQLALPFWLVLPLSLLALDLGQYWRHRLHHATELFWRMHRLHHADEEIDTRTAFRFHPFEVALAVLVDLGVVFTLGVPPAAIVVFFAVVVFFDIWEHASVATPPWTRRLLPVFVTPEMHRMHHGDDPALYNANFGIVFSLWDRLFGTFRHPAMLTQDVRHGLGVENTLRFNTLGRLLMDPFRKG